MSSTASASATADTQRPLTEVERVVDVFVAPSKTFEDIKRNANWVVPLILMILLSVVYAFSIGKKITFETAAENQIKLAPPSQQDQINSLPADQKESRMRISTTVTKYISYGFPVLALIFTAIFAGIYLLVMNFGLGAQIKFGQLFSALMYAGLVRGIMTVLAIIGIWTFIDPADFNIQMPLATSPGALFAPLEHPFLFRVGAIFDVFAVWSTILAGIAMSVLSGKKRSTCIAVAFAVSIGFGLLFALPSLRS
ncbi:MAG: hypothetical protein NVS9B15_02170 [Acidobacteriaceae bacterium]